MKYYKHKTTGDIIGVTGCWIDLLDGNGNTTVITQVVMPGKWLGAGILWHSMSYYDIKNNYRRTNRAAAFEMYPDFGQWRHQNGIDNNEIKDMAPYYLEKLLPLRNAGFGTTWIKDHPLCPNDSEKAKEAKKVYENSGMLAAVVFIKKELNTDLREARDIVKSFRRTA